MVAIKITICAACGEPKAARAFNTMKVAGSTVLQPNCIECSRKIKAAAKAAKAAKRERKPQVRAEMRACACCGVPKKLYREYTPCREGGHQLECRQCRKELGITKAELSAHAKRKNAAKLEALRVAEAAKPRNTTNPFEWRTYVQPFQPPPDKWVSTHKTTPTKEQMIWL